LDRAGIIGGVVTAQVGAKQTQGGEKSVGTAFLQYRKELHRFLVRQLRGGEDAHDLAQDLYVRVLQIKHEELVRQPQAYLYRMASSLLYEYRLRGKRSVVAFDSETADLAAEHAPDVWGDQLGEQLGTAEQLERVLSQLPPLYRQVLVLQKRDGLSYEEVAKALGISRHTVKKYLFRALAQCRSAEWDR
jgi:RNA polymerase sigma factor (sigma-70 family)